MTALAAARLTKSRRLGSKVEYPMAASTQIWAGGMVMLNSAGLATPAAAAASNQGVVGVATESVLSAASGTYYCVVQEGDFQFAGTTLAQTDVGNLAYAEDDQTIDETQGANEPVAGVLVEVESATVGWVRVGLIASKLPIPA